MGKSTIKFKKDFIVPDFTDRITTVGTGGSWTATEDCWVYWSGFGNTGSYCTLYVNDISIGGTYVVGNYWTANCGYFPLKKGDIIKSTRAGSDGNAQLTCQIYRLK